MQRRAPNRIPPPIPAYVEGAVTEPVKVAKIQEANRLSWIANFEILNGYKLLEPTDSYDSIKYLYQLPERIRDLCSSGDLEGLRLIIEEIRDSDDPILRREKVWRFFNKNPSYFVKAFENNHWHIIKFLTEIPFEIPPLFANAVADRALLRNTTDDLQHLVDLGWDINNTGSEGSWGSGWGVRTTTTLW
jgi:hypothetical protein